MHRNTLDGRLQRYPVIHVEQDYYAPIARYFWDPRSDDPRFKHEPQTIFYLDDVDSSLLNTLRYAYSSEMYLSSPTQFFYAQRVANESGALHQTAQWANEFVKAYYARPILVTKIIAGLDYPSGYPFRIYEFADPYRPKYHIQEIDF